MLKEFEVGPIRPPSEANSLLLRITRNCSWNKCKFCVLYKGESFRTRTLAEIKEDIDQVVAYRNDILSWLPADAPFNYHDFQKNLYGMPEEIAQRYLYILNWMLNGKEQSIFLQDANTMVLTFDKLMDILTYLKEKLPQVQRITSYGRVDSLSRFSVQQLTDLKEAGLNRIHSGYETGSDKVLALINKGYSKAQEIEAGQKVKESGIELSIYVMPGVGGVELSDDNALETADVISKVNPDFVRVRTFISKRGTGLMDDIEQGRIQECTDKQKLLELKKMITNITGADGFMYSDHIINLLEGINGNLGTEKEKMLALIQEFEDLTVREQQAFQIARRMGIVQSPRQMKFLGAEQQGKVNMYLDQLQNEEELEGLMRKLMRRYI